MTPATLRWGAVAAATAARRATADRGGLAFAFVFTAIVVGVIGALWRAAAGASGGEVVGYTAAALTWYIATSEAATVALDVRLIETVGDDIVSGAVATEMLRPAPVLGVRMASQLGRALPCLVLCFATGAGVAAVTVGAPPEPAALALAAPSLALAVTCNLLAQHGVAAAAFWIRDARSGWFLYQKLVFILGGMLMPLQVLPDGLARVAAALPFSAMAYVPARLASGHVEPELLLVQAGWVVVLGALAAAAFAAGERRLQVVGG